MLRLKTLLQYNVIYVFLFLLAIAFSYCFFIREGTSLYKKGDTVFEGVVLSTKLDGDKFTFLLKGKEKLVCTYYLQSEKELPFYASFFLGQKVRIKGVLTEPQHNTIPNTFDYHDYLKHQSIHFLVNVEKIAVIEKKTSFFYYLKNALINYLNHFKSAPYLQMFIMGNKHFLEEGVYEQYQNLGVSHIFAISGMHISLLTAILFKLLKNVKEGIRYFIVILFLLFYLFLTNYTASVLRSVTFFIILFLNKRLSWNLKTVHCFFLTISFLLFIKPSLLYDIGFRYSSLVSFSLVCYSPLLKGSYIMVLLKVSILAFLFSLPITVNQNYEINLLSILYNLFFVPLISFIIYPLNLLVLILNPLDSLLYALLQEIEALATFLPVGNVIIPKLSWWIIVIYYIFLYFFLKSYQKKYLLAILLLISIVKILPIFSTPIITFLDVGQGDSAIIRYRGETVLIDTGGKVSYKVDAWKEKKQYILSKNTIVYLKSMGITHLEHLILTHGDFDHMGEAMNIINDFKVEKVVFNCGGYNNLENELIKVLNKKNIKYYSCIKELNIKNNKLHFLNTKEYDNENDYSSVISANFYHFKFLFMGDASTVTEKEILTKYNLSQIDVLKVGHHGSKTSSSEYFINIIKPRYSIISVGKNNRYGHPNKEILENLNNSKIYRTDDNGSIMLKIKKNKLEIETCPP